LILVGIALGVCFWFTEALIHVLVFSECGLARQIFTPPSHEVWMRLAVVAMFVAFGIYSQRIVDARRRAEESADRANAELVGAMVRSVRRICSEPRPGILDDFGLAAGSEWQTGEFSKRTGIHCDFSAYPADIQLDRDLSIGVFRIYQEALSNVARHSGATRVRSSLRLRSGELMLKALDNGRGLSGRPRTGEKTFGLIGIRERARDFGGWLRICDAEGGTARQGSQSGLGPGFAGPDHARGCSAGPTSTGEHPSVLHAEWRDADSR
jgi:hypothetical protein